MEPQVHPGNRPALDQSLTDAEYDRLAALLDRFPGEDAMDAEEMDGFFAALISGPVTIPPSVYLGEIWGGEETPFGTAGDFEDFLNLAMRHWNFVARVLASRDLTFLPWLMVEEGEEVPRGNRWAQGFPRGVSLCRAEWEELFEDEDKFAILLPVLALAHENDPDPELRSWKNPPDRELREKLLAGLSVATQKLDDYFRSRCIREARPQQTGLGVARRKIGRNDPCSCGSGKKYKRCCGGVTVH
jgi:uncharacterized protein